MGFAASMELITGLGKNMAGVWDGMGICEDDYEDGEEPTFGHE